MPPKIALPSFCKLLNFIALIFNNFRYSVKFLTHFTLLLYSSVQPTIQHEATIATMHFLPTNMADRMHRLSLNAHGATSLYYFYPFFIVLFPQLASIEVSVDQFTTKMTMYLTILITY